MATRSRAFVLDRIGAVASLLCAVHCLLVGVALSVLSVLGLGFLGNPTAELTFFSVAILVGGLAVYAGYRHHRSMLPATFFGLGVALVALSHFVLGRHDHTAAQDSLATTALSVSGGLLLVLFHVINTRMSRRCHGGCSCPHHEALAESDSA